MQFQKNTSIGRSNSVVRLLIKVCVILLLFFGLTVFIDKIDFPSPNKKIEKIISNENLKIVK
jgi:hypothetical protein